PRHAGALRHFAFETCRTENFLQIAGLHADGRRLTFGNAYRHMAQHAADLAFEIAYAGLARVVVDDHRQHGIADLHLIRAHAVGFELPAHQITLRNLQLLLRRVAG